MMLEPSPTAYSMKQEKIYLTLVLLIAAAARLFQLGHFNMWFDEAATWIIANRSIPEILSLTRTDNTPPLHFILMHFWLKTGAESDFALRLPSVLIGFLSVYMTYRLGKILVGTKAALLAALISALSFSQVQHSQQFRMYSLQVLLALCSTYCYIKGLREDKLSAWAGWFISGVLMFYNHLFAVFLFFSQWLFFILSWKIYGQRWKKWLGSNVLLAIFCLPWLPVILSQMGRIQENYWVPPATPRKIFWMATQLMGGTMLMRRALSVALPNIPLFIVSLGGFIALIRSKERDKAFLPIMFLTPPVMVYIISNFGQSLFVFRYFLYVVPFLHLIMAYWIVKGFRNWGKRAVLLCFVGSLIGLLAAYYSVSFYSVPQRRSVREAYERLHQVAHDGDVIIHHASGLYCLETYFVGCRYDRDGFQDYVWREAPPPFYFGRFFFPKGRNITDIDEFSQRERVWVLTSPSAIELRREDLNIPRSRLKEVLDSLQVTVTGLGDKLEQHGFKMRYKEMINDLILFEFVKQEG